MRESVVNVMQIVSFMLQFIHLKRCIISGKSSLHFSEITFWMVLFARRLWADDAVLFPTTRAHSLCSREKTSGSLNWSVSTFNLYRVRLCQLCFTVIRSVSELIMYSTFFCCANRISVFVVSVQQSFASTCGSLNRVMRSLMYVHYLRRCSHLLWSSPNPLTQWWGSSGETDTAPVITDLQ